MSCLAEVERVALTIDKVGRARAGCVGVLDVREVVQSQLRAGGDIRGELSDLPHLVGWSWKHLVA